MRILIVDDEMNICLTLKNILQDEGHICEYTIKSNKVMNLFESFNPDVVLLDVRLDGANGLDILKKMKEKNSQTTVIMISGHSGIKEAVRAIKLGAYDFLEKPLSLTKVKIIVNKAYEFQTLSRNYNNLKITVNKQIFINRNIQISLCANLFAHVGIFLLSKEKD